MAGRAALAKGGMLLAHAGVLRQVLCSAPHTAPPGLCPPLEPHSEQGAVPTDAGTPLGSGSQGRGGVGLLAVPIWHGTAGAPARQQGVQSGQAGCSSWAQRWAGTAARAQPCWELARGRGTAGVRLAEPGKGPSPFLSSSHPQPSPAELVEPPGPRQLPSIQAVVPSAQWCCGPACQSPAPWRCHVWGCSSCDSLKPSVLS